MDDQKLAQQLGTRWHTARPGIIERLPHVVSNCNCCGSSYTLTEFRALKSLGIQEIDDGELPHALEYHNCSCGSTLAIVLNRAGEYYEETGQ